MVTISATEAESRFHEILDRVCQGEEIVVTKDDQPIARVVPERPQGLSRARQAVDTLRSLRQEMASRQGFMPLTDEEILSAIHEGHKY